jgi:hypothetical protein
MPQGSIYTGAATRRGRLRNPEILRRDSSPVPRPPLAEEDIINLRKDSADAKGWGNGFTRVTVRREGDGLHPFSKAVLDRFRRARITGKRLTPIRRPMAWFG